MFACFQLCGRETTWMCPSNLWCVLVCVFVCRIVDLICHSQPRPFINLAETFFAQLRVDSIATIDQINDEMNTDHMPSRHYASHLGNCFLLILRCIHANGMIFHLLVKCWRRFGWISKAILTKVRSILGERFQTNDQQTILNKSKFIAEHGENNCSTSK